MINEGDLLQANSVVIAGILILLTISSFKNNPIFQKGNVFGFSPRTALAMIILPFSLSSITLLLPLFPDVTLTDESIFNIAGGFSVAGFAYLATCILFLKQEPKKDTKG